MRTLAVSCLVSCLVGTNAAQAQSSPKEDCFRYSQNNDLTGFQACTNRNARRAAMESAESLFEDRERVNDRNRGDLYRDDNQNSQQEDCMKFLLRDDQYEYRLCNIRNAQRTEDDLRD